MMCDFWYSETSVLWLNRKIALLFSTGSRLWVSKPFCVLEHFV